MISSFWYDCGMLVPPRLFLGGDMRNTADLLNAIPDDFQTRIKYLKKIENREDM